MGRVAARACLVSSRASAVFERGALYLAAVLPGARNRVLQAERGFRRGRNLTRLGSDDDWQGQ